MELSLSKTTKVFMNLVVTAVIFEPYALNPHAFLWSFNLPYKGRTRWDQVLAVPCLVIAPKDYVVCNEF